MVSHCDVDVKFSVSGLAPGRRLADPTTANDGGPGKVKESTLTSKELCRTMKENQSALEPRNLSGSEAVLSSLRAPSSKPCGNLKSQSAWLDRRGRDAVPPGYHANFGSMISAREDSAPPA